MQPDGTFKKFLKPGCEELLTPRSSPDRLDDLSELLENMAISTPETKKQDPAAKKPCDEAIKFGPVTKGAIQQWQALLKRQSTESLPSALSTPQPAGSRMQLMKMDEKELAARYAAAKTEPAFAVFLQGVHESMFGGDALKTMLAYELWLQSYNALPATSPTSEQPDASTAAGSVPPAVATPSPPAEAASPHATPANSNATPPSALPAAAPTPENTSGTPASATPAEATPSPDCPDEETQKKEARATYMRYYRSVRSSKCPEKIATLWRDAAADPSGAKNAELFAAYLESNEDWLSSTLVMTESQSNDTRDGGRWGWLSKADP